MTPYKDWKVGKWHQIKVAIINKTFFGKVWPDGATEPKDWITEIEITTHLDEGGVGAGTDTIEVSFDDLVVADNEDDLTLAVNLRGKLPLTWGKLKSWHFKK